MGLFKKLKKLVKPIKKLVKPAIRAGAAYYTGGASEAAYAAGGSSLLKTGAGLLQNRKNKRASRRLSEAEADAAERAQVESSFRPVGMTTRFGQSNFKTDAQGNVIGGDYSLSPALKAQQDRFAALSNQGLAQAERAGQDFAPLGQAARGLFSLGRGYLAQTPAQAASQFMAQQQNLLAPSRERMFSQLQNSVFNAGRQGLAVGATGMRPGGGAGLGASQPELEAYYNAVAQQDAELATRATQGGMDQTRFGAGLFDAGSGLIGRQYAGQVAALGPYEQYLAQMKGLEGLGQQAYDMGTDFGQFRRNAAGGQLLQQGLSRAAESRYGNPSSTTADILTGLSNANFFKPAAAATGTFANPGGFSTVPQYQPSLSPRSSFDPSLGFGGTYNFDR